jgi:hypothetical protein
MPKLTDPSILEVTTLADGDLIHNVDVSDLTDVGGTSKKINFGNFKSSLKLSDKVVLVNSIADLPTASLGIIQLEPKRYLFNDFIDIGTDSLQGDPSGNTRIEFTTLNQGIQYSGTGSMIVGDSGSLIINKGVLIAPNGSYFDFDNSLQCYIFDSIFLSSANASNIKCDIFTTKFCSFYDYGDGFIFNDRTDGQFRTQVVLGEVGLSSSKNNPTTILDFLGSKIVSIFIEQSSSEIQTNETLFNFSQDLKINNTEIVVRGCTTLGQVQGTLFQAGSLDDTNVYSTFNGNLGLIPNSVVSGEFFVTGNSAITNITAISANTRINTDANITASFLSRLLMQDVVTLNFTTDILTVGFNHGMVNNDRIFLKAYTAGDSGTLPPELDETTEYFVINATATTFQLSLTQGGSAINFTTNGTGIIHYRHNTGVSRSFQIIYSGTETVTLTVLGWGDLINNQNSFDDMRTVVMNIASNGVVTERRAGSVMNTNNARQSASNNPTKIRLNTGEGFSVRVRNDSAVNDLQVNQLLIIV